MGLKTLIKLIDPKTLIASVIPVVYGSVYAWYRYDALDYALVFWLLVSMILIQSSTNLINDYSDFMSGADLDDVLIDEKALTNGETTSKRVAITAAFLGLISLVIGFYIAHQSSYGILWVGLSGGLIAMCYSMGPYPISHMPIGEVVSGLTMGLGITSTVIYVQSGILSMETILVALPTVLFIGCIMLSNNMSDVDQDRASGRRTLPIVIGVRQSELLWGFSVLMILALAVLFWLMGIYPRLAIFFMLAFFSYKSFKRFFTYGKSVKTKALTMKLIVTIGLRLHIGIIAGLVVAKLIE